MVDIIDGQLHYNEANHRARGGTEMMAQRIVDVVPFNLLQGVQIINSRVRELKQGYKRILLCHDLPADPEMSQMWSAEWRAQFDQIVFVSHWQKNYMELMHGCDGLGYPVIHNAIEWSIGDHKPVTKDTTINITYHTTPHRGLAIAFAVVEHLVKLGYNIHFDVFSSFKIYGWEERDKPYEELFDKIRNAPWATYHGTQPNDVVIEHLKTKSHIFLYPSVWPETSCIALIEAAAMNNICIHPDYAALPETIFRGFGANNINSIMYPMHKDHNQHANIAAQATVHAIERLNIVSVENRLAAATEFGINYDVDDIYKRKWIDLLSNLER